MKILIVIDMQKDFVNGALGSAEAEAVVPAVCEKIRNFDGRVIYTRDTHEADYLQKQEGKNLPVEHCIRGTDGWQLDANVAAAAQARCDRAASEISVEDDDFSVEIEVVPEIIDKPSFGSVELGRLLQQLDSQESLESITLTGLCTDICVISNAMIIKAFLPEIPVIVDASCCAGVTPESHAQAIGAMKACQIIIENEN